MNHVVLGGTLLISTIMLCGCDKPQDTDRYEIKQDNAGHTIRLDKKTGELAMLQDGKLAPIRTESDQREEQQFEAAVRDKLATPRYRASRPIEPLGVKSASCQTMWRDGKMFFQISFTPPPRIAVHAQGIGLSPYRVVFVDGSNFNVVNEPVPMAYAVSMVDEHGKVSALSIKWSVPLSEEAYESITDWTVSWF